MNMNYISISPRNRWLAKLLAVFLLSGLSAYSFGQCVKPASTKVVTASPLLFQPANSADGNFSTVTLLNFGQSTAANVGNGVYDIVFNKLANPGDSIVILLTNTGGFTYSKATSIINVAPYSDASGGNVSGTALTAANLAPANATTVTIGSGSQYKRLALGFSAAAKSVRITIHFDVAANQGAETTAVPEIFVVPGKPTVAANQIICSGSGEILTATYATAAGDITNVAWYTTADTTISGSLVFASSFNNTTGSTATHTSTYVTPANNGITAYYVTAGVDGCTSSSRNSTVYANATSPATSFDATPKYSPTLVAQTNPGGASTISSATSLTVNATCLNVDGYIAFVGTGTGATAAQEFFAVNTNGNTTGYAFNGSAGSANILTTNIIRQTPYTADTMLQYDGGSATALATRFSTITDDNSGTYTTNGGMKVRVFFDPADTVDARTQVNSAGVTGSILSGKWFKLSGTITNVINNLTPNGVIGATDITGNATYGVSGNGKNYVEFSGIQNFGTFFYAAAQIAPGDTLNARVFLQGASSGAATMSTSLNTLGLIPLSANSTSVYGGAPFNYTDTAVTAASIPANAVDWVMVEVRSSMTDATTTIERRVAFLKNDGTLMGTDGSAGVRFSSSVTGSNFIAIRHRNHLPIVSSSAVAFTTGGATATYDFTAAQNRAYQKPSVTANAAMALLPNGLYGMWGGNTISDNTLRASGLASVNDYNKVLSYLGASSAILGSQYNTYDVNLDGTVRASGLSTVNDYNKVFTFLGNLSNIYQAHY